MGKTFREKVQHDAERLLFEAAEELAVLAAGGNAYYRDALADVKWAQYRLAAALNDGSDER